MEAINELIVVKVTNYNGTTTPDKNGKEPVMLQCIAGTMPNRNVLAGTLAERAEMEVGKTYLMQVREIGDDKQFGRSFNWIVLDELHGTEIIRGQEMLGRPTIVNIPKPEGFEDHYHRKGDAVESNVTMRIKNGLFEPAYPRSVDHKTAVNVIKGTSVINDTSENISTEQNTSKVGEEGDLSAKQ